MTDLNKFTTTISVSPPRIPLETVVIHFAGDSGDGMQVAGMQLTQSSASAGNDVRTFSDFPAEIRAPAGTLPGVSGFQLSFSQHPIYTPGDKYDVLIAMNPAALTMTLPGLSLGGILILDEDKFTKEPLPDTLAAEYRIIRVRITSLTLQAVESIKLTRSHAQKCKNMFALGIIYWLYNRTLEDTKAWIQERFKHDEKIITANIEALRSGYHYAQTAELFTEHYTVPSAPMEAGIYRQITGNQALGWGCIAVALQSKRPFLLSGYPITPASDIMHMLAKYTHCGISLFQAEDEIAAIGAAIGAAYGGGLAISTTSGPGMDLKSEALGLAVMVELPLVIIDVQRAGPSTGMPTKVEQSDLLMALFGRHGECPLPVLAASTPSDCFDSVIEAFRIAVEYMTPVILLSDAFLANSAAPWKIPEVANIPAIVPEEHLRSERLLPYERCAETLARPWIIPGTPDQEHRIGGLEKAQGSGNISYDPDNHQHMVNTRAAKIQGIAKTLPPLTIHGKNQGKLLVIGWGSTYGAIRTAVEELQAENHAISAVHLRYLHPIQKELSEIVKHFQHIVVVELNTGQLRLWLRSQLLVDAKGINKVTGRPFSVGEIKAQCLSYLEQ